MISRSFRKAAAGRSAGASASAVTKNSDGSYEATISGGRVAEFGRWCGRIRFTADEYDTGCLLDEAEWE